jgi:membrane fusion protein, heavy metal efflux system
MPGSPVTGLGARVSKGDPVVEFFSPDLAAAKNEYEAASVQHALDRKVLALSSRLPADHPVSRQAISDSEDAEARSRLGMKQARDRLLLQVGLSDKEIQRIHLEDGTERSNMILRAPMGGLVILRSANPGEQRDPKDTVFRIAREDPLWVTASVPKQDLQKIKVGQELTVIFPFDDRRVKARVESIDPRVDPQTHKFTFRTSIPNPDRRLKPGMFVRVNLETDARHDTIDKPRGPAEPALEPATIDRLNELERKLDRLLGEKEQRSATAKILERLDALEHKVDQLLGGRQGKPP